MRAHPFTHVLLLLPIGMLATIWLTTAHAEESTSALPDAAQRQQAQRQAEEEKTKAINRLESPDGPAVQQPSSPGSELTGVMVDRTITMAGKTFYRSFSQHAMGNPVIGNATITIRERPDARWGSQLWIMENNHMYFRTQLSPKINEADRTAAEAVKTVEKALLRQRLKAAITSDKDLGSEELF